MATQIEILDSIMGSSKTNGILKWIDDNPNERYIYVSPLISEINDTSRVMNDLKHVTFVQPTNDDNTKSEDLLEKLREGSNICCTHSLYLNMSEEHLEMIQKWEYVVIIDEEVGVIDDFKTYSTDDLKYLLDNEDISISDVDGMISWVGKDVGAKAKYRYFYNLCKAKAVYATKRKDTMMVTQLPVELFTRAKRVIIMTYMFDGNVLDAFLTLKKIETIPFTEVSTTVVCKEQIKKLIDLQPINKTVNLLGMSYSDYKNKITVKDCTTISNYIRGVCRKYDAKSVDVMYTFPKTLSTTARKGGKKISPIGFREYKVPKLDADGNFVYDKLDKQVFDSLPCWLASSTRATNNYSFKWCLVHCYNRYPNLAVDSYLKDYQCSIDRNVFALSEMLQWIWRSRIRKGEPIVLAIASQRMYNLFLDWLNKD